MHVDRCICVMCVSSFMYMCICIYQYIYVCICRSTWRSARSGISSGAAAAAVAVRVCVLRKREGDFVRVCDQLRRRCCRRGCACVSVCEREKEILCVYMISSGC